MSSDDSKFDEFLAGLAKPPRDIIGALSRIPPRVDFETAAQNAKDFNDALGRIDLESLAKALEENRQALRDLSANVDAIKRGVKILMRNSPPWPEQSAEEKEFSRRIFVAAERNGRVVDGRVVELDVGAKPSANGLKRLVAMGRAGVWVWPEASRQGGACMIDVNGRTDIVDLVTGEKLFAFEDV